MTSKVQMTGTIQVSCICSLIVNSLMKCTDVLLNRVLRRECKIIWFDFRNSTTLIRSRSVVIQKVERVK